MRLLFLSKALEGIVLEVCYASFIILAGFLLCLLLTFLK